MCGKIIIIIITELKRRRRRDKTHRISLVNCIALLQKVSKTFCGTFEIPFIFLSFEMFYQCIFFFFVARLFCARTFFFFIVLCLVLHMYLNLFEFAVVIALIVYTWCTHNAVAAFVRVTHIKLNVRRVWVIIATRNEKKNANKTYEGRIKLLAVVANKKKKLYA